MIRPGRFFNVQELNEEGRPSVALCFAPLGNSVIGNIMLAQKIALETDKKAALKVANRRGIGGGDAGAVLPILSAGSTRARCRLATTFG